MKGKMKMKQLFINNKPTDYMINQEGKIYSNKTKKELTGTVYNTGYRFVRLTTEDGKKGYAVHRLVAQTFIPNPKNLPIVNHKDGNKLNNNVNNLEWVTQSENRYHAIKTQISNLAYGKRNKQNIIEDGVFWKRYLDTNYLVSKEGRVYNTKTKILLKATPRTSGYIVYTLRINNKNITKQAHILVLQTWRPNDNKNMIVNHIDGNPANNNLENLEWVTKRENALHSCYTLKKLVKPIIQTTLEGQEKEYPSIIEAARALKVTDGAIRCALKTGGKSCNSFWRYK